MIEKEKDPMEYYAIFKSECPYCRNKLFLIAHRTIGEYGIKGATYYWCLKCDKIFEKNISPTKELNVGYEVRQLYGEQEKEFKIKYKERFDKWMKE